MTIAEQHTHNYARTLVSEPSAVNLNCNERLLLFQVTAEEGQLDLLL